MRRSAGFTLVELLIAVVILAVGVIAAATMQTTALRTTNLGNVSQELTRLAEAELEMQRQLATPTAGTTCLSGTKTGYSCQITAVPCLFQSATANVSCTNSPVIPAAERVAYQTTITVTGPNGRNFTVSQLILLKTT